MPIPHRRIPALPERPRVHPIACRISRSYSVGRQDFSRAWQGKVLTLTIASEDPFPEAARITLATTLDSDRPDDWKKIPFERVEERLLICNVVPTRSGLHSFRAEFSLDGGATWVPDTVPDAWVLVDPPHVDGLRLYTMIPSAAGTIADWTEELKRIQGMGFNAVHLLPITSMDASESPYAAKDLFSIDRSYLMAGSSQDGLSQLDEFVEQARALNIRLCFDLVLNHVGVTSAIAARAPDWIVPDQTQSDGLRRARYWSTEGWHNWDDLVLINYEHPSEAVRSEIWQYMTEYALFWANFANATGGFVRFDNLHSSDPEFVHALTTALHADYPELGLQAEFFTNERTLLDTVPNWGLNLVLATPWSYKFVPQLREYLGYIHRVSDRIRYFMPITSHDSGAPAEEFGTADSTVPRYVAAALLGTGATGMPQGVEFGEVHRIDFIGRKERQPMQAQPRFAKFIAIVNEILAEHPAFRCGDNCFFVDDGHAAIIAAFRKDPESKEVGFLVVCNFDTTGPQKIEVDLGQFLGTEGPFKCSDLVSGEPRLFSHSRMELALAPGGAVVLQFHSSS